MMNTKLFLKNCSTKSLCVFFFLLLFVIIICGFVGYICQNGFGRVSIDKISYANYNGLMISAKLFKPESSSSFRYPSVLYLHGYQSCSETNDPYCIELARRGIVVLSIDAIGRGNSDVDLRDFREEFDTTYGAESSFNYLKSLSFVDTSSLGLMGHSIGASIAYDIAMKKFTVKALTIVGNGYKNNVTTDKPKNLLMIFGRWDEFRRRMTETSNFYREWMNSRKTIRAFPVSQPEFGVTYGNFENGTARMVFVPNTIHIMETHNHKAIAQALAWMQKALSPPADLWIDENKQIWHFKELCSLLAMLTCFFSLLPLSICILRIPFFHALLISKDTPYGYICPKKDRKKFYFFNSILIWLYIPCILILFGFHKYLLRIDYAFPLMVVNAIVWWFLISNIIGFILFKRWYKHNTDYVNLCDLGISFSSTKFQLDWIVLWKTLILASILFCYTYFIEFILEAVFLIDFRFVFSFANNLTPYRVMLFFQYIPFLLIGFLFNGIFLHGQIRINKKRSWLHTFISSTGYNLSIMITPFILLLLVQYLPLLISGYVPFTGPGDVLVLFMQNILHIIAVMAIVITLSTWFFQITGKIYLGAVINSFIVSWMFTSTQVIAPIPV